MMGSTIDESGYNRKRYQPLRREIAEDWAERGLPDVTDNTQSVPGRIVSQLAGLQERNDALVQAVIDAFNPYAATGEQQSRLAPVMGKRRNREAASTVTLTVTADANGTTIPAGSQASDGTNKVATRGDITVAPSSSATVFADAVEVGPIEFNAGTITKIETPVFGWESVTNPNAAEPGTLRESDTDLRFRMLRTSASSSSSTPGIFNALSEIDGVTYAFVHENDTDVIDSIGADPHSIFPIVDGGSDNEIGSVLLRYVAGGIGTNESIPGATITEVNPINPANRQSTPIYFARPADVEIEVQTTVSDTGNIPPDYVAQIREQIVEYVEGLEVGADIYDSDLYCPINAVGGLRIVSVTLNKVGEGAGGSVVLQPFERAAISDPSTQITVTLS